MPEGYSVSALDSIDQLKGKDVVMLFGKTRAGKSTFINDAYGSKVLKSTGSMTSDTNVISYVTPPVSTSDPSYPNIRNLFLVDTIGLSGSSAEHNRALLAAKWIKIFCSTKDGNGPLHPTVKGFLYFIDIADQAGLNADNLMNLKFFQKLVGTEPDMLKSIVFVTTKWQRRENKSLRRGQERRFEEWKKTLEELFPGSRVVRLGGETSRMDIEELDESLEENQAPEAKEKIARERANYTKNVFTALGDVLAKPVKVASKLECELIGSEGDMKQIKDVGIGQVGLEEGEGIASNLEQTGEAKLATLLRDAVQEFADTKVTGAAQYVKDREQQRGEFASKVDAVLYGGGKGEDDHDDVDARQHTGETSTRFMSLAPFFGERQRQALHRIFEERMMEEAQSTAVRRSAKVGRMLGRLGASIKELIGSRVSATANWVGRLFATAHSSLSERK